MERLEALLSQMTLEEKIGQLTQYNANLLIKTDAKLTGPVIRTDTDEKSLQLIGNVLNFRSAEEMRLIQKRHLETDPNHIPIMFMMDVIHGYRTIYPIPLALGCSFDANLVEECSRMAAKEAASSGVQVTFAPMVDYVRDARWGRVMESCGEDNLVNSVMGAAQVRAFQGENLKDPEHIACCVKHFAAYGGAEAGRDYNTVELSENALREHYLPAYKACIDAGAAMLMPSFNSLNGVPAVANDWLMEQILRKEWQFDGVVISDYNAIGELTVHGVAADLKEATQQAFSCGCHIDMCSDAYHKHLRSLVEEGVFTIQQLDSAVMDVLRLKERLGLFEDPYHGCSSEKAEEVCLSPKHREISRKAAADCAVLLKNEGILPLSKELKRIALIGPFADEHSIIGYWACCADDQDSITVRQGVEAKLPDAQIISVPGCGGCLKDKSREGFDAAVEVAKQADAVILCLGEPQSYSGEGNSRSDLGLPGVQMELAREVFAVNPNTAVVLFNGRPLAIPALDALAPAILEMWFPGTEGGNAVADLLFGDVNPSGKLTMSFPYGVGQCPIYYNHPMTGRPKPAQKDQICIGNISGYIDMGNLPLYSFGHGLSYSNFVYEELTVDTDELTIDSAIQVTVTVHNDSPVAGKETVQLYMRDLVASVVRPVQQLIAFEKITLMPGERKMVTFTVTEPMLRLWNRKHEHISEPGEFILSTGYADHLSHFKKIRYY